MNHLEHQMLRIGLAQANVLVGDIAGNVERILSIAAQGRQQQLDLVVFPELAITGYPPEDLLLRPGFIADAEQALIELAHQVGDIHLVIGHPIRVGDKIYNAASVLGEGKILHTYHKQVLPNYAVFDEKRYFTEGHESLVFTLKHAQIGITVCEDIWHRGPANRAVAAGAELVVNINASPFHRTKMQERERIVRERLQEIACPVLYLNVVGGQDELLFDGRSFVMDAQGSIAAQAAAFEEQLLVVEFKKTAQGWVPICQQPLPAYSEEELLYGAIVLGVKDYVRKNGFPGVLIGLSGGVDSALTLAIAVDALGADAVQAIMMPSQYTASMSLEDAAEEARLLGVTYQVISIEPAFQAFLQLLRPAFGDVAADATEENIQARCRGILLMALSNKSGKMVLTTGNKSEMSVGYATLYGDMAGGFAPIKDLPKIWVYRLCRYRNALSKVIPERVLVRPPSAELAHNQLDQDSLPPYERLDILLEKSIELDQSQVEIVGAGFDASEVSRVVGMIYRNEYKRRQSPPGVRLSKRAFGKDRRYPITSGYKG